MRPLPPAASSPALAPRCVHVVVDPSFGPRLSALPPGDPVWVIDSLENDEVARRLREQRRASGCREGITTFRTEAGSSPERDLILQLGPIDMRHGVYSGVPPFSVLAVIGCRPSRAVRLALSDFGLAVGETTTEGFIAVRPPEPEAV